MCIRDRNKHGPSVYPKARAGDVLRLDSREIAYGIGNVLRAPESSDRIASVLPVPVYRL